MRKPKFVTAQEVVSMLKDGDTFGMMGMTMANNMMNQMGMNNMMGGAQQQAPQQQTPAGGAAPKFCPNCGQPTNGAKFCGNCGQQLA